MLGRIQWSPDGSQIFFTGPSQIADVVQADGSRLWGIDREPGDLERGSAGPLRTFDVSADGSKIAYSTCSYSDDGSVVRSRRYSPGRDYEIFVSSIDGADTKRLTENSSSELHPVWSPDGTRVAFVWHPALNIHTVATDYTVARGELFNAYGYSDQPVVPIPPAWSPDGLSLAFLAYADGPERGANHWMGSLTGTRVDVYTVGSDGTGLKRIVSNAVSAPSWSPDGGRIAVASSEGDGAALYTFTADGTDPVMVVRIDATDMVDRSGGHDPAALWVPNVSWSPDGSKIMYGALSVVNVADGSVVLDTQLIRFERVGRYGRRLVNYEDLGTVPLAAWSPDGSRIAMLAGARADVVESGPLLYIMNSDGTDPRILVAVEEGGLTTWPLPVRRPADVEACSKGRIVPDRELNPGLVEDCRALLGMRDKLAGYSEALNWSSDTTMHRWGAIGGGGDPPRIQVLTFDGFWDDPRKNLYGQIPPEIGNLAELRELRLFWTHMNGRIPSEIGSLANLEVLELERTHVGGRIPSEIGNLTNLKRLVLKDSQFSGSIPPELGKLTYLTHLDLSGNDLTGSIPSELSDLVNLTYLNLHSNRLTGCLPDPDQPRIRRCN